MTHKNEISDTYRRPTEVLTEQKGWMNSHMFESGIGLRGRRQSS